MARGRERPEGLRAVAPGVVQFEVAFWMPAYTTDALILRTYKLGESDRIVVFLTRDRGKRRGVAKNARQSRRRFGGALEPLTLGRVGYVERERRELVHLQYVEPLRSPLAALDANALGYVGYFAELIDEWAQEADPNETLFRLGASMVDALAAGVAIEPLARYFEYWLLRLQGVYEADARLSSEARDFLVAARGLSPFANRRPARDAAGAERIGTGAPDADRDAFGEEPEIGSRASRVASLTREPKAVTTEPPSHRDSRFGGRRVAPRMDVSIRGNESVRSLIDSFPRIDTSIRQAGSAGPPAESTHCECPNVGGRAGRLHSGSVARWLGGVTSSGR